MTTLSGAFSPSHANLQLVWDSTSMGYLKECPRKYYYAMVAQRATPGENIHFTFGAHYHQGQERYHKLRALGKSWAEAVRQVVKEKLIETWGWEGTPKKNREVLIRALVDSFIQWENDPFTTYHMANGQPAVELSFKIPLAFSAPGGESYVWAGHLDRVVRFGEELFTVDYKTTASSITSVFFEKFSPDNQMTGYTFAGKVILSQPIRGVMVEGVQLLANATRFMRAPVYRTEEHIAEWLHDLHYWLRQAETFAAANYWPMNDKSCGNYGGCTFQQICAKAPAVRATFLSANYEQRIWDPTVNR